MKRYTVRLEDGTVGSVYSDTLNQKHALALTGQVVRVHLHDENGKKICKQGVLAEVLETITLY